MKRQQLTLALSLLGVLTLTGCNSKFDSKVKFNDIPTETKYNKEYFALKQYNVPIAAGETYQIEIDSIPSGYSTTNISYESKNTSVATVSDSGLVTAVADGLAEIYVKSNDGVVNEHVNVYVSTATTKSKASATLTTFYNALIDPDYVEPDKVWTHEYLVEEFAIEGNVYNKTQYIQDIKYARDEAYFEIYSEDIKVKTEGGNPEVSSGKWLFFVDIDSYFVYLCHEVGNVKNYYEVNGAAYGSGEAYQILYDVLNLFFVSGQDIITDTVADLTGYENVSTVPPKNTTGLNSELISGHSNISTSVATFGTNTVYGKMHGEYQQQLIDAEDELDGLGIPARTRCDYIVDEDYYFGTNGLVKGSSYGAYISYVQDGTNRTRNFAKQSQMSDDFELNYPDLKQFAKVDSLYDL